MKKLFFLMSLGLICNVTLLKAQDIINPIGVTMSLPNTLNTPLINIVNGAGLSEFPSITATHENNGQNNALLYFNGVNLIDFDLGGNFDIEGFAFWNAVGAGGTNFGVKDVIISASEDGVNFTPIPGSPIEFAEATPAPLSPETFSFNAIAATHIRIQALNNHGEPTFTGISEVAFIGTSQAIENVINPVSATTTLSAQLGSSLDNAINGVGLDAFPSLSATHEMTSPANSFLATNEPGSIDFDLGGSYLVDGLSFWNENAPGPGQTGIQAVVISASEDGVTFTPIAGSPSTFAQVVGPTSPAEVFTFTPITASYIRFDVISNYGDPGNLVAFAEVAFSGTPVILGVSDSFLSKSISLFPNPATDVITINNGSNIELEGIHLYDMHGRIVKQIEVLDNNSDHRINVSELSSGIYLVHIYNKQASTTKRVIKK